MDRIFKYILGIFLILIPVSGISQTTAQRWNIAVWPSSPTNNFSVVIPNAKIYICAWNAQLACNTTFTVFSDYALTKAVAQPLVANSAGVYDYYVQSSSHVVEKVCGTYNQCSYYDVLIGNSTTIDKTIYPNPGVPLSTGNAWGSSFGLAGTGVSLLAPSGTPSSGEYVDGGTFAWTPLPPVSDQLEPQDNPPASGQYVIVYPTAYTTSSDGTGIVSASNSSGMYGTTAMNYLTVQAHAQIVWSAPQLPSYVNPANVTAIYAFAIAGTSRSNEGTGQISVCGGSGIPWHVNSGFVWLNLTWPSGPTYSMIPDASSFTITQTNQLLTGLTGAALSSATFTGTFLSSDICGLGVDTTVPKLGFYVYYTGAAPPVDTNLQVAAPLYYLASENTLGIDPNAQFPGTALVPTTIASLRPASGSTGWIESITDGTTATDCTTGGGSNRVLCQSNGSSWVAVTTGGTGGVTSFNTRTGAVTLSASDVDAVGSLTNSTTGNAATASALAATPTLCANGQAAQGITANGNATGCFTPSGSSGVSSLNALSGAVNITAGSNVTVTPSGQNIQISASGGGNVPSNAMQAYTGISANDDDGHVIEPTAIALSGYTCASGTCTATTSSAHGLSVGDWVNMREAHDFAAFNAAMPSYEALGTGYTLFQVASVPTTTSFTFAYTAASPTCSSSCGSVYLANYNYPFATWRKLGKPGSVVVKLPNPVNIVGLASNYTNLFHSISPAVTGTPGYLIINNSENDTRSGTSAASVETAYQSVFTAAHADGWTVAVGSSIPFLDGQIGNTNTYANEVAVQMWLKEQKKTAANAASGAYWDLFINIADVVNNPTDATLVASNGGFGPAGAGLAADETAKVISSGMSSLFTHIPKYWGMLVGDKNVGSEDSGGQMFVSPTYAESRNFLFTEKSLTHNWLTIAWGGLSSELPLTLGGPLTTTGMVNTGAKTSTGVSCLQIDSAGNITNTGFGCSSVNWSSILPLFQYGTAAPSSVAPSVVQYKSAASASVTYTSNVTAGHTLFAILTSWNFSSTVKVTDTLGTPYSLIGASGDGNMMIYAGIAQASGSDTLTWTGTGGYGYQVTYVIEAANVAPVLDNNLTSTTSSNLTATMSETTTAANDLLLSIAYHGCCSGGNTFSPSSGWTGLGSTGSSGNSANVAYQVAGAAGLYSITWTYTDNGSAYMLSLKPAAENQVYFQTSVSPYSGYVYHTGAWQAFGGSGGGSGLSGMTAGQVPIAATSSTVTSSKPLAGSGTGITTGPASSTTANNVVTYADTAGTTQDSGVAVTNVVNAVSATTPIVASISGHTMNVSCPTCGTSSGGTNVSINGGSSIANLAMTGEIPLVCLDSSGSGTAQNCTTVNTFTPQNGNCWVYETTTTNSGTGLTLNVNSLGAKSIAIPGASGWTTTLTSGIIPANKPLKVCYDGTNINVQQTGTVVNGGGVISGSGSPSGQAKLVQSKYVGGTSLAFSSNVTSGHLLIGIYTAGGSTTTSHTCSDTLGTTLTTVYYSSNSTGAPINTFVCMGVALSSGADTITMTASYTSFPTVNIMEFDVASPVYDTAVFLQGGPNLSNSITLGGNDLVIVATRSYASGTTWSHFPELQLSGSSYSGNPSYMSSFGNFSTGSHTFTSVEGGTTSTDSVLLLIGISQAVSTSGSDGGYYYDTYYGRVFGPRATVYPFFISGWSAAQSSLQYGTN